MKRMILRGISLILPCLFFSFAANAQRPVWLVAHACNCQQDLINAKKDGANGIEIDVATSNTEKGTYWSVGHRGYYSSKDMESWNKSRHAHKKDPKTDWVSLEQYLKFEEINDEKICVLWLDNKTYANSGYEQTRYLKELVEYVHKMTDDIYGKGNLPPYSIVYGIYYVPELEQHTTKPGELLIDYLAKNLRPNEGINIAWEDLTSGAKVHNKLMDLFNEYNFPREKHLFTNGFYNSTIVKCSWARVKDINKAHELRNNKQFCGRIGYWTAESPWDAYWFFDTKVTKGVTTDCDVVLAEGRNHFSAPFFTNHKTVQNCVEWYLKPGGYYYSSYNNGRIKLAGRTDQFWPTPESGKK